MALKKWYPEYALFVAGGLQYIMLHYAAFSIQALGLASTTHRDLFHPDSVLAFP
jgi:hypothetical protein